MLRVEPKFIGSVSNGMPLLNTYFAAHLLTGLLLAFFIASGPLQADHSITLHSSKNRTALVELYTSEGCSSCPPAEQWLQQLIQIPNEELDALVLEFHVDYWDYIGWKDRFGSAAYTARQRKLAHTNQQRTIYTPEFFVDGKEARGTRNVVKMIKQSNSTNSISRLQLTVKPDRQQLTLTLHSKQPVQPGSQIHFVVFHNKLSSLIKSGENAGRKLHHQRVVRYFSPAFTAQPQLQHVIPVSADWDLQNLGVAALLNYSGGDYSQSVSGPLTFELSTH